MRIEDGAASGDLSDVDVVRKIGQSDAGIYIYDLPQLHTAKFYSQIY